MLPLPVINMGGRQRWPKTPQPSTHAKNGFFWQWQKISHSCSISFCMGCSTEERLRNFKKKENQEIKWQKVHEHRRVCFSIKSSLQFVLCAQKDQAMQNYRQRVSKVARTAGSFRKDDTSPRAAARFPPICVSVTRCPF